MARDCAYAGNNTCHLTDLRRPRGNLARLGAFVGLFRGPLLGWVCVQHPLAVGYFGIDFAVRVSR